MASDGLQDEHELTLRLRRALKRTWQPLFGRFGRLTEVQLRAMPHLLRGASAIVCAPTATGKTEAAIAPLAERLLSSPPPADEDGLVRLLYVTPTRALANDLETRLLGPLADAGLRFAVRTGERKQIDDGRPVDVLVTTPESLDSMLARKRRSWQELRAVVLDEIHLVDGTPRGDQLRVLLRRLRTHTPLGATVQVVALSATVADPESVAERYLVEPTVIQVAGQRPFELSLHDSLAAVVATLRAEDLKKSLFFSNSRRGVEEAVAQLGAGLWPRDRVVAHHGSLGKRQRLEAEDALRRWTWGIGVATTTLEIGIDVGNIDAVVLLGPPPSIEALLQRMGRACRRGERIRVLGLAASQDDQRVFAAMADQAAAGELPAGEYTPDLSVIVQQLLSLLYEHPRGLALESLVEYGEVLAPPDVVRSIAHHLAFAGHLTTARDRLALSQAWMDEAEKGRIHSTIADDDALTVVDARTGKELGQALVHGDADMVRVAGRVWRILKRDHQRAYVEPLQSAAQAKAAFGARESMTPFTPLLPPELRLLR